MIFIDSNVPMYLIGAPHPNKTRAVELVNGLVCGGERLVTDVEVYQEILHRYTAIRREEAFENSDSFRAPDGRDAEHRIAMAQHGSANRLRVRRRLDRLH